MFDGLGKFLTSPAGLGLLALGTGGAALAAAPAAGAAGAAGATTAGATGATSSLPGLLGGSQINLANSALLMNGAANPAAASMAAGSAPTGLLGTVNAGLKEYAPLMNAASVGINTARGAMGPETPPVVAPPMQPSMGGSQALSQIASSQLERTQNMLAQADQERRERRMQRRGLLA